MKKIALTNLIVLFAIKSVSGCERVVGYDQSELSNFVENYSTTFVIFAFVLILPIVHIYYLRKNKPVSIFILTFVVLTFYLPTIFFFGFYDRCENSANYITFIGFLLMLTLFIVQLLLLIEERKTLKNHSSK